jgi:hypothetical protein
MHIHGRTTVQKYFFDNQAEAPPDRGGVWVHSLDAAAKRCNFTRRHVEQLIADGVGPATVKFGRRVGIIADDLADWVQTHRRPAPGETIAAPAETTTA